MAECVYGVDDAKMVELGLEQAFPVCASICLRRAKLNDLTVTLDLDVSSAPELLQMARQNMVFMGVATAVGFLASPPVQAIAAEEQEFAERVSQLAAAFNLGYAEARARFRAYCVRRPSSWHECWHEIMSGKSDW